MGRNRTLVFSLVAVTVAIASFVVANKQRERLSTFPDFSDTKLLKLPNANFFFSGPLSVSVRVPRLTMVRDRDFGADKETLEFMKSEAAKSGTRLPQELVTPHGGVVEFNFGTWDDGYRPATPSERDYEEMINGMKADKDGVRAGQWWGNGGEGIDSNSKQPACSYRFWSRKYTLDIGAVWPKDNDEARREAIETMKCVIYSIQPDPPDWKPAPETT